MKMAKILMGIFCVAIMALSSTTGQSASPPSGITGNVTVTNPETNPVNVKLPSDREPVLVSIHEGVTLYGGKRILPDGTTEQFSIPDGKVFVLTDVYFYAYRTGGAIDQAGDFSVNLYLNTQSKLTFAVVIPPNYRSENKIFSFNTGVRSAGFSSIGAGGSANIGADVMLLGYLTSEP